MRAWKGFDGFEGRSAVKSWLYRIATNVCLSTLQGRQRRALPMDLGPGSTADIKALNTLPENVWLQPVPDGEVGAHHRRPGRGGSRARQHPLGVRRRAPAPAATPTSGSHPARGPPLEGGRGGRAARHDRRVGEQRAPARPRDAGRHQLGCNTRRPDDEEQKELLERYVDAFERYDIDSLVSLLHEDATMQMPPHEQWIVGGNEIGRWFLGGGIDCKGSRIVPLAANGSPAIGQYRRGGLEPWSIQVLETSGGRITGIHAFVDANLFPLFGLPARLEASPGRSRRPRRARSAREAP